jgi:hypothetical protein
LLREHYDKVHKCIVESYNTSRCCSTILFYKVSLLVVFIKTLSRGISIYISVIIQILNLR